MLFLSSSSSSEEVEESKIERGNFIPGIFVNLCSSESENSSESDINHSSQRYFVSAKAPLERIEARSVSVKENCKLCGLSGHSESECSLRWRRYILKAPLSKPMLSSVSEMLNKWCYHCAQQGHFGDECMRKRFQCQFTAFHAPLFSLLSKTALYYENSHHKNQSSPKTSPGKSLHKRPTPNKRPKLS